ncbi:hypothetical protein [Streptomyces bluensis]|uniref:hypothetical protein n=1 Tax=Streptomyces bluensis TaxID=33897 RepID=UPI001678348D|nr:hypothetical protein [Streptomyces bluensis]GGZ80175.1 hypothetical protein GCM10010344_54140 [Streptomyces bluensis]
MLADAITAAGPGRHYLHVVRPLVAREALAEVLYLGGNRLALGPVSAERFDRLTRLVDRAVTDASNRCGSSVLSLVSDSPTGSGLVRTVTRYIIEDRQCTEAGALNEREYGACAVALARAEADRAAEDARMLATLPSRFDAL